jgi:stress response protein SCP2
VPKFFADIKKDRANKTFDKGITIKRMNCPMDIMADIIDKNVIRYADRLKHKALRTLLNQNVKGKGNRQKRNKVIELAEEYKKYVDWINLNKESMDDSTLLAVRNRAIDRFLNKANNNLDQETVMLLVSYAVWEGNSDICTTILNFLYRTNKNKLLNCFVKKD